MANYEATAGVNNPDGSIYIPEFKIRHIRHDADPQEQRDYVTAALAIRQLIEYPESIGFALDYAVSTVNMIGARGDLEDVFQHMVTITEETDA